LRFGSVALLPSNPLERDFVSVGVTPGEVGDDKAVGFCCVFSYRGLGKGVAYCVLFHAVSLYVLVVGRARRGQAYREGKFLPATMNLELFELKQDCSPLKTIDMNAISEMYQHGIPASVVTDGHFLAGADTLQLKR
jgi:hypothetical protein